MSENSSALAAACLTVGLSSAWAPAAKADLPTEVRISSSLAGDVAHAIILLGDVDPAGVPGVVISDPTLAGGVISGGGWMTIIHYSDLSVDDFGAGYAMVGVRELSDGTPSLVVSGGGWLTHIPGASFEEVFPGYSQGELIERVMAGGPEGESFLRDNFSELMTPYGTESAAFAFSQAVEFGGLTIDVVAVPAPGALAIAPLAILAAQRRRRSSAG